jgi:hypothetical protein
MRAARRIPIPVPRAGAAASYGVAPSHVMLNPQPLPPRYVGGP